MYFNLKRRDFLIISGVTVGLNALPRAFAQNGTARVRVMGLKVENIDRPMGLEKLSPRLSWQLESDARNVQQNAYRILVASSEDSLMSGDGDLWDSGKVNSRKCFGIHYQGRTLASRQRCWWSVKIWYENDQHTEFSEPSWWEMGLLAPKDWTAQWLAVEDETTKTDREFGLQWIWGNETGKDVTRKFRYRFNLQASSRTGVMFMENDRLSQITGIWLDGRPVGRGKVGGNLIQEWLDLGPLAAGDHVVALEASVRNSRPHEVSSANHLTCFARFALENGKTQRICTDPHWKTSLALEKDWYLPNYDDHSWEVARVISSVDHQPWPAAPAMNLRREFNVTAPIVKARLYATALGAYEARLNGHRVGDALLTPEPSQYARRILYRIFDVTSLLRNGTNVLGVTVGDGWYASWEGLFAWGPPPRRLLAQMELTLADGSRQIIATGPGWQTAQSPIRISQMRRGETYDANYEQPGWDAAGFNSSDWQDVLVAEVPSGRLTAHVSPPIRAMETLKPRGITQPKPGEYVVDFGQGFSGWCRLRVKGAKGTRVELRFAEDLAPSGEIDQFSMGIDLSAGPDRQDPKTDVFILKGEIGAETFEPHFTYRGFRYVQISGLLSAPTADSIEGIVIHSDLGMTGHLRTDSTLLNQIWQNTLWTQRSNIVGIQTDCPSREQRAWLGDTGIFYDAAAFNMDMCAFTSRTMDNWTDDQFPDGAFSMLAPFPDREWRARAGTAGSPPAWGDAAIIIPWMAWQRYGDIDIIERNWHAMNHYVQFIHEANPEYVWRNKRSADWGDWLAVGEVPTFVDSNAVPVTPKDLVGTAYWAHSLNLLAQMSQAIGRDEDAKRLRGLFEKVRGAFIENFVLADGTVGNGSQASYVFAVKFGLLPEALVRPALEKLAADVRNRGVALTTGIVGTQFILDVLADADFTDLAYGLLLRTEYPSWGYMFRNGATTIWENWRDVKPPAGSSHNHPALGSVCGFLFRRIAGIDAGSPGFESIVIRPMLDPRVKKGGGDYDSIMGRISTDWDQMADGSFILQVTIPCNTTARIHLPAASTDRIREGLLSLTSRSDVKLVWRSKKEAVVKVGSGQYRFVVQR